MVSPGGSQQAGDPDAALGDGDRRAGVRHPAGHRRRGPVRQPRDGRQQHGGHGHTGQRQWARSRGRSPQRSQAAWPAFTGLADDTAEALSLQFTSGSLSPATSSTVVVNPAAASTWIILQQPSATATAGQPFVTQPELEEEDAYGNRETGDNTSVVTAALSGGTGPLQGTTTVTVSGGVAAFTSLADDTAETLSLQFSGNGVTSLPTSAIVVSPAAPSKLVVHTQPSATALVQQAFGTQPVIDEEDQYGNLETGDNNTVITAALSTGAGPLLGTTAATVSGGVATFTNLADSTAGSIALQFTSGNLTPAVSYTVDVNPAVNLEVRSFTATPGTVVAGGDVTYTIVVSNGGPSPATGFTVTSPLGTGAGYVVGSGSVNSSGSVTLQGSSVVASVPTLVQGASVTLTFTVSPSLVGTLTGAVSVAANEANLDTSNNTATVSTTVVDRVGTIQFSRTEYTVPENAGSAAITVSRVNGARGTVTVDYTTVPINATPGLDYTPVSGTLTFPNGVTSQTIAIPVLDDPYDDHNELVSVVLSKVQTTATLGQPMLGTPSTATLTIQDIDPDTNPLEVSNVQSTGSAKAISQIFVTFTQPLITVTATNPANYALVNVGPDGKFGTLDDTAVPFSVAMAPASSFVVVLTPAQPLPANRFFHLELNAGAAGLEDLGDNMLAGNGTTAGTSYTAMLARGTSLKYFTPPATR